MKIKKHIIKSLSIRKEITDEESIMKWIKEQCGDSKLNVQTIEILVTNFTLEIIKELVSRFSDIQNWQVLGVVDCDLFKDDSDKEKSYVVERTDKEQRKHYWSEIEEKDTMFSAEYIWETKGVKENDFYGSVLLPVYSDKYIKIGYSENKI